MLTRTAMLRTPSEPSFGIATSAESNQGELPSCYHLCDRILNFLGGNYSERAKRGAGGSAGRGRQDALIQ